MLDRVTARFDALYSPTALAADRQPPAGTRAFFGYFLQQFRGGLIARFVLVAAGSLADAMLPIFVGWTIGMLSTTAPGQLLAEHGATLALMLAVVLLRPVFFVADALVRNHAITPNLVDLVRWQSHWHVIRQSWTYFQNDFAGRIGNKVLQAGESLETVVNLTIDAVWYAAVFVVVAIVVLAGMDPLLLVPIALWLVGYGVLFRWTMPKVDSESEAVSDARSVMSGRMVDSYANIQTLKTFADDGEEDAYVAQSVTAHAIAFRRLMAIFTWSWSLLFLLNALLVGSVTWIALAAWDEGRMSTAMVATAIPFVLQIMNISGWILEVGSNVFRQIGTVRDSMVTIAQPLTLVDAPDARPLVVGRGEVTYDRVSFDYWRGDRGTVVDDFSLTVAPGERIGLVGRSGAGKSTLVNLTLRMFDVRSGAIRIDGQDIRSVTQQSLRRAIGVVGQDTSLLHRSVRDNIKYGRPGATDAEMILAAQRASVHEVVMDLVDPEGRAGYDAHVGERGVKLSGGQRQRIALARVILKDAPILVLDEATSALDSEVEAAIQDTLYRVMQGKTVIAIAHRLSTIARMDRIVVLDAGRVVEEGSHGELLARGGLYAGLWGRQSGGFLDLEAAE
ncbi:MAG TPA: ABC transporter ATP-binding protein [Thermomicrobiales bacterium]|nr:ABC transporter ATP-binding protein [Thermomicrobiales bacterium]